MKKIKLIGFRDTELELVIKWGELLSGTTDFSEADKELLEHLIQVSGVNEQ